MTEAEKILTGTEFDPEAEELPYLCDYDAGLGYAYAYTQATGDCISLIGFTGNRQPSMPIPGSDDIRSVTRLNSLPSVERTVKMHSRGVGTRMYNTPEACYGTGEGTQISAYLFDIGTSKIVDRRRSYDDTFMGHWAQRACIGARLLQAEIMGPEAAIESVHESFGDPEQVDAVLYNQSLTMKKQQKEAGIEQTTGIPPEFLIIRNSHIVMHKIGEYRRQS